MKIMLLKILLEGRVKPENSSHQNKQKEDKLFSNTNCNTTGIVRDSREFIPIINGLCASLKKDLEIEDFSMMVD